MCGIIGYIGNDSALPVLMDGLHRMEYRGYDSAGVALVSQGVTSTYKRSGKLKFLAEALSEDIGSTHLGIGHTRWATHGVPNEVNAHPHQADAISIVHNGIIENYSELRAALTEAGRVFVSETDSEVIAHLIAVQRGQGLDVPAAVIQSLLQVKGTFGLLVTDHSVPDMLIAVRRGSPLLLGITNEAIYAASDATAIVGYTDRVIYLEDDELAVCTVDGFRIIDFEEQDQSHEEHRIEIQLEEIEKGGHDHFLIKEIMEQPRTITDILRGRLNADEGTSHLGGLNIHDDFFISQTRFLTVGCGTAYYAGMLGKYLLERMTGLPVDVEYGSEFRYREPVLSAGTLGLIVSQSGETADTLASLRELKRRSIPTLGLVNVVGSSVAREVDGGVYLHAGPEISVASTKAFTAQVIAQLLVGLTLARKTTMGALEGREVVAALSALPEQVQQILDQAPRIKTLAKKLSKYQSAMYLGRDSLYPVALEASHKLKEISYIHAEAYPAGEMKHGANALIDEDLLVVFLMPQNKLYEKSRSNLEEVRARGGHVLLVGTEGDSSLNGFTNDVITVPTASDWTLPILVNIPLQLFAYYMAVERGTDVDQPRNLAKSVTVE
jgi:glucosamine--fructose-6-phosphate aminotransferase (isomerizing)